MLDFIVYQTVISLGGGGLQQQPGMCGCGDSAIFARTHDHPTVHFGCAYIVCVCVDKGKKKKKKEIYDREIVTA